MNDLSATVVAVATPPGRGGVGCVRLSGEQAPSIAARLFRPAHREPAPAGPPTFGCFVDRAGQNLDHGYLVLFPAGGSFTGEATAELWPHGAPVVLAELVSAAIEAGARPAEPGEFTYRALRNGRLDLARAEAVRDLVAARTLFQARVAFAQAEGAVAERLAPLRESLEEWIARAEAAVEFVDESETHLPPAAFRAAIDRALALCRELLEGFRTGRVVRDGATLAIVGRPNAGKSSLFNRLLARERAIVTEIEGTTRDTLEESIDLDGIPARLVDTAGLRDRADRIELEGVRRARQAREEADLVLLVLDGSHEADPEDLAAATEAAEADPRTVVVVNKCDLELAAGRDLPHPRALRVSAKSGAGIAELKAELRGRLTGGAVVEDPIITDARHARALERTVGSLEGAVRANDAGLTEELVLEDLRQAIHELGTITGEFDAEQLYDRIFSKFCIGK
ncbi:MAG: tRNA uridine-5-carboxymethylaminomethyl(34) synthesis GTPase MnmE [bacterium]|nr:tRNA uridine-5-carboxymethylaminomethyl(34) synthesis GTPase MnmE [bacterium]